LRPEPTHLAMCYTLLTAIHGGYEVVRSISSSLSRQCQATATDTDAADASSASPEAEASNIRRRCRLETGVPRDEA